MNCPVDSFHKGPAGETSKVDLNIMGVRKALIGFSLNSAAYMAEILRSSLDRAVEVYERALRLIRLSYWQSMKRIILPQSVRIAIPPLSNVLMDLIKASSLAAMITVPEIFQKARIVGAREYDLLTLLILVALIYWAICSVMTVLQNFLEKRYAKYL